MNCRYLQLICRYKQFICRYLQIRSIWRYLEMNWRYLQIIWRYLQFNWIYLQILSIWRYLQLNWRYLQFIWRYLQMCRFADIYNSIRGRSQLSTFMKAYTAYARGEGVWDHRTLFPRKSTFIFNHWQCIIKYCTCLECGQYAHIYRSFMYNNTFEALFLTSKCTKRGFLWTQTVAPHRGFCKAA